MSAFLAALAAIPAILSTLKSLIGWLTDTFGANWPQRVLDLQAASVIYNKAQTDNERNDAIKAVAAAFNSHK